MLNENNPALIDSTKEVAIRLPLRKRIFKWAMRLSLGFLVLSLLSVVFFRFVPVPITPLMLQRSFEHIIKGDAPRLKKDWVPIEEISEHLVLAVICAEDQKFEDHTGFDWDAITKAVEDNKKRKKKGKAIHGGSTISQQCAKNVFLLPSRSWLRKGFEVYFTFLIETFWSKERIMEVYLNVIEMGDGIYGAEAASQAYFKKSAAQLTKPEAALIAIILPNPRVYSASHPSAFENKRKNWVLRQMNHFGEVELDK